MAEEQLSLPNMPTGGKQSGQRTGAVASVKKASDAVKTLLGVVDQLDAKLLKIEKTAKSIAASIGAAGGKGFNGGSGTGAMGLGSSGNNMGVPSPQVTVASRVPHTLAAQQHGSPFPLIPTGPPAGFQTMTQQAMPGSSANPAQFGGGGGAKYGPGNGQGFFRGSGGNSGFLASKVGNAEAFFLPQLIGKVAGNVQGFAGGAYDDNILANQFAVGTSAANGRFGAYQSGMYRRMAQASFGGAYNAQDRQQGLGVLGQQFSTSAVFGGGTGQGGNGSLVGQTVGLSQSVAGLGLTGAAQSQTAMNRPQVVNNLRAYGVQARDSSGGVNYQRVATQVLDRIFGKNAKLTPDQVAYSFEPGNGAYYDLSNMGFDENTIQIIRRLAMGRAQAGWGGGINLSDNAAGRKWRSSAGLSENVTNKQLQRAGQSGVLASNSTAGAVSGIDAANESMSTLSKVTNKLVDSFSALQGVMAGGGAVGGVLGTLPGSPGSAQSGVGSSALNAVSGTASLGLQYGVMRAAFGRGQGMSPTTAAFGRAAPVMRPLAGAAVAGLAANVATNLAEKATGTQNNKWAQTGGDALTGASMGAAVGMMTGPGAVVSVPVGAAVGGLLGAGYGAWKHFAEGGVVPGNHNNDTVGIKATPGEVVVPRHTVNAHGGAGELIRKLGFGGGGGDGDHYASGGEVWGNPDSKGWASANLTEGHAAGLSFRVNKRDVGKFEAFITALVGTGYRPKSVQGYNNRNIAGSGRKSNHAYGAAIDIDPGKNPRYGSGKGGKYALPSSVGQLASKFGLNWGGNYHSSKDYMHFEDASAPASSGSSSSSGTGSASTTSNVTATATAYTGQYFAQQFATGLSMVTDFGANAKGTTTGGGSSTTGAAPTNPSGNVALAKRLAAQRGWTGSQWNDLYALWQQESGFSTTAGSPAHAYGIAQALPGSKMATKGSDWRTNPSTQILWGLDYISSRYGNPTGAEQHKHATDSRLGATGKNAQPGGWYSQGAWETKDEVARLHQGEMVMPAKAAEAMRQVMREQSTGKGSSSAGTQVHIHLTVAKASDAEARRFAGIVKQQIESDSNMAKVASS